MRGVILDTATVGETSVTPITSIGSQWQCFDHTEPEAVNERIMDAEIVVTNKVVVDANAIRSASDLKFIAIMATGTNVVDLKAASKANVPVANVRAYGTPSVAQHTLTLMLNLATNIPNYARDVSEGAWQQSTTFALLNRPIFELSGKTLGIVGYGELGSAVAKLAEAFGMCVLRYQRPHTKPPAPGLPLADLAEQSDFLSLHCPLTDNNHHLIDEAILERLGPQGFLINTARGGLVNSEHLLHALRTEQIAGAALDVLEQEPPTALEPLLQEQFDNLIITPHSAWAAIESRQRVVQAVADNIAAFQRGEPQNLVNE